MKKRLIKDRFFIRFIVVMVYMGGEGEWSIKGEDF